MDDNTMNHINCRGCHRISICKYQIGSFEECCQTISKRRIFHGKHLAISTINPNNSCTRDCCTFSKQSSNQSNRNNRNK